MKETNITELRICPKCGKPYHGVPALSRDDNKTLVCPDCGIKESLESIGVSPEEQENILRIIHENTPGAEDV